MKFHCPHCNQRIQTDISRVGKKANCPNCKKQFVIPINPLKAERPSEAHTSSQESFTATTSIPQKKIVKTYRGSPVAAHQYFIDDSVYFSKKGYRVCSEHWQDGQWGCGAFILAIVLCFFIVGFFIFLYLLIVKPAGSLIVTYELEETTKSKEKICHMCSETVKYTSKICKHCKTLF